MARQMRRTLFGLCGALLLGGCADDVGDLVGPDLDGGVGEFCEGVSFGSSIDYRVGAGLISGEPSGCNMCNCGWLQTTCGDGGCELSCTAAACIPDAEVMPTVCTSGAECGQTAPRYRACAFNAGCEDPSGFCIRVQSFCDTLTAVPAGDDAAVTYCGCDGVTYEGPCPLVPYRHSGPCR